MANLADDIEQFLKELIGEEGTTEVQRAMIAAHFGCAPSQINYVLATRFSPSRGYVVESRRGGGGYIRIIRLNLDDQQDIHNLIWRQIGPQLTQDEALGYIHHLREHNVIDDRETAIMQTVIDRDTIGLELPIRDIVRANLLKAMVLAILRF